MKKIKILAGVAGVEQNRPTLTNTKKIMTTAHQVTNYV